MYQKHNVSEIRKFSFHDFFPFLFLIYRLLPTRITKP